MSNLEPIDEKDLDLESKFKKNEKPANSQAENKLPSAEREQASEIILAEKDKAYDKILSKVQGQVQDNNLAEIATDAEKTYRKQDSESQIQHLVDIALDRGVIYAVKVAKHMEDNYVLDMFHDRILADELHEALIRKGLVEDI